MQDPQVMDAEKEPLPVAQTPDELARIEAENAANEAELLRQSMARNYLQHCINSAAADGHQGQGAVSVGIHSALVSLILTILNGNPEAGEAALETIAGALGTVNVGEEPMPIKLMEVWAVAQGRQGLLNTLLGRLRDRAEADRNQFLYQSQQQVQSQLAALTAQVEEAKTKVPVRKTKAKTGDAK